MRKLIQLLLSGSPHAINQYYETRIFLYLLFEYFYQIKYNINNYIAFLVYFNLNSKLLPGKSTQKVDKQKIRCKNHSREKKISRFVDSGFVVRCHELV